MDHLLTVQQLTCCQGIRRPGRKVASPRIDTVCCRLDWQWWCWRWRRPLLHCQIVLSRLLFQTGHYSIGNRLFACYRSLAEVAEADESTVLLQMIARTIEMFYYCYCSVEVHTSAVRGATVSASPLHILLFCACEPDCQIFTGVFGVIDVSVTAPSVGCCGCGAKRGTCCTSQNQLCIADTTDNN